MQQSPFEELIEILEHLPRLLHAARTRKRQSLRQASAELGTSPSTVMRWENGETVGLGTEAIIKVLRWVST